MATATSLIDGGTRNAFDTIAASTSNSSLVAAQTGKRIRVLSIGVSCNSPNSTVVFKSNTTAISCVFQNSISLPSINTGWFQTVAGEELRVDTGVGSTTGVIITWQYA